MKGSFVVAGDGVLLRPYGTADGKMTIYEKKL